MRTLRPGLLTLLAAGLLAAAPACRSASPYDIDQQQTGGITLVVQNDNFADVDVYAYSSGLATRVGMVTGHSSTRFALNSSLISTDFRVVATPIGGNGRAASGLLSVGGGQTVNFTVGSVLSQSFATVQ